MHGRKADDGLHIIRMVGNDLSKQFRRFLRAAKVDQRIGKPQLCRQVIGIEAKHLLEHPAGDIALVELLVDVCRVHQGLEQTRAQRDGLAQVDQRLFGLAVQHQAVGEIVAVIRVFRLSLHRLFRQFDGNVEALGLNRDGAQEIQRFGMVRVVAQHELVPVFRLPELSGPLQVHAALQALHHGSVRSCRYGRRLRSKIRLSGKRERGARFHVAHHTLPPRTQKTGGQAAGPGCGRRPLTPTTAPAAYCPA